MIVIINNVYSAINSITFSYLIKLNLYFKRNTFETQSILSYPEIYPPNTISWMILLLQLVHFLLFYLLVNKNVLQLWNEKKNPMQDINSKCVLSLESICWRYLQRQSSLKSHPMQKFLVKHPGQMVILSNPTSNQEIPQKAVHSLWKSQFFSKLFFSDGICVLVTPWLPTRLLDL